MEYNITFVLSFLKRKLRLLHNVKLFYPMTVHKLAKR